MAAEANNNILYQPDERPPFLFSVGFGFQAVVGMLVAVAAYVSIIARTYGQPDSYLSWAIFSAFVISGGIIVLQSTRFWRLGSGYTLISDPSAIFIAICATALNEGGPP